MKTLTVEEVKKRIKAKHKGNVELDESTYINTTKKATFIDIDYGEWKVTPNHVMKGHGHMKRARENNFLSIKEVKKRIKEKHGNTVTLDESTYVNTHVKATFIDIDYGEWKTTIHHVMKGLGHPKRGYKKAAFEKSLPVKEVKKRIKEKHGNTVTLDESTYVNTHVKATFIDIDYGEWKTKPHHVMRGSGHIERTKERSKKRAKKTCLRKYGVEYAMQDKTIAMRSAKATNNSGTLKHWKTGEELVYVASYEKAFIEHCNENKIDFRWQDKVFHMVLKNGRKTTYRPDAYLFGKKKWIEIKGYFRDDAQEKWEIFHERIRPNSELWGKNELKKMGIL